MSIAPFQHLGSSEARVFGVRVFRMPETAWYYRPIMYVYRWANAADRLRWCFINRYVRWDHVIRLAPAGGYGFREADDKMFMACFEILGEFVEHQLGRATVDTECQYRGYRLHSGDQPAIDLWLWYRYDLDKLEQDYIDDLCRCYSGKMRTAGEGLVEVMDFGRVPKYPFDWPETVKEEKLNALMTLRRSLWT